MGGLITQIGLGGIMLYSIITILNFMEYGFDFYGNYIAFYIFMWVNTLVLDKQYKVFPGHHIIGPSVSISQEPSAPPLEVGPSVSISQEPSPNKPNALLGGNKYGKK